MNCTSLHSLASRHCAATKPSMNMRGFVADNYNVGFRFFAKVSAGKKKPSQKLLLALNNAHHRLFPNEPVMVEIPNHLPVLLGIHPPTNLN